MARGTKRGRKELVVRGEGEAMFNEEQLRSIRGFTRGADFVEVYCGCTSKKLGDTVGNLKVTANGHFSINCLCCLRENFTPDEFERHAREGVRKWKSHIWVQIKESKVPLWKTPLLKYYRHASNVSNWTSFCSRRRHFHRDEFIRCSVCNKQRRFRLRNKDQIQVYHDALANPNWKCSDSPSHKRISCEDEEERVSRRICRGCPRRSTCKGCTSCVCFGCVRCRFLNCNCRTCVDFMQHGEP